MKHIKTYRLFENLDMGISIPISIREDITDMAVEIKDNGLKVAYKWIGDGSISYWTKFSEHPLKYSPFPNIYITFDPQNLYKRPDYAQNAFMVYYNEIESFYKTAMSYLNSEGYHVLLRYENIDGSTIPLFDVNGLDRTL